MNIGDLKGVHLDNALLGVLSNVPNGEENVLEIGSYCGYSSTRIAMRLRPGGRLVSVECAPQCVAWTKRMLGLTNLSDRCDVLEGTLASRLDDLKCAHGSRGFDLVFLDHDKDGYLSDLCLLEACGLVRSGTVVVADNVLMHGQGMVAYLAHVRNAQGAYCSSELHRGTVEYSAVDSTSPGGLEDGVEVSVFR